MNKAQIETVERLRHEGKGLSAIAKETGISINTIKSHFSRHGIPAPRRVRTCLLCHSEIETSKHFCSDACRAAWYESHCDEAQDILHVCKTCGALFEPRIVKQVYCSKPCFYNDRYHSRQDAAECENLQQMLMSIPRETAVALIQMAMEILLSAGWRPPTNEQPFTPSNIADSLYTQLSLKF